MHILIGIFGAILGVLFLLWRINMAARAAGDLVETADDARKWFRRKRWQKKSTYDTLREVSDPREAAAAMMVAVAQCDGAMTEAEKSTIVTRMKSSFEVDDAQATDLLAYGRYLAQESTDLSYFLKQLAPPIERVCTPAERQQLISMLTDVAGAEGDIDGISAQAITELKRRLMT